MKTVATALAVLAVILTSSAARADGFRCEAEQTGLKVKVFNNTDSNVGTRAPAIMVVSDPTIASDRKTIATFKQVNRTLSYQGYGVYTAKVDLRFNDSGRAGENIAGTKLGQLANIKLTVEFDYAHVTDAKLAQLMTGSIEGKIEYIKRNGEILEEKVNCFRYLKN